MGQAKIFSMRGSINGAAWPAMPIDKASLAAKLADLQVLCGLHPWTVKTWRIFLEKPTTHIVLGFEPAGKRLIASSLSQLVIDEAELLQLFVHPHFRQQSIGRTILEKMIDDFKILNILNVFLEVYEKNQTAVSFYTSMGLKAYAVRKNYFRSDGNRFENALLMRIEF